MGGNPVVDAPLPFPVRRIAAFVQSLSRPPQSPERGGVGCGLPHQPRGTAQGMMTVRLLNLRDDFICNGKLKQEQAKIRVKAGKLAKIEAP